MSIIPDKPYPRFCAECGNESVMPTRICYNAKMKHDGKSYEFPVDDLPIDKCENCNEQWFTVETDDALQEGLRTFLCLLHPSEIRQRLQDLGLTQSAFAERIGVAAETVSRWLNGHAIQNRAMDNLIRLFFGLTNVRSVLSEKGPIEGLGVIIRPQHEGFSWVKEKEFSERDRRRRDSFQLRIQTTEAYVR
jgi:transcriptional regulator with XRE-family HTH domain